MKKTPMRVLVLALLVTTALAAAPGASALVRGGGTSLKDQIRTIRAKTWTLQQVMGKSRKPAKYRGRIEGSPERLVVLRDAWRRKFVRARWKVHHPPRRAAWLCIKRYEGAWTDPNAPYYGGLQMDVSFQRTYGARLLRIKGTANNWKPLEQIWVAEKAYRSGRGFHPWPNTARRCGLI